MLAALCPNGREEILTEHVDVGAFLIQWRECFLVPARNGILFDVQKQQRRHIQGQIVGKGFQVVFTARNKWGCFHAFQGADVYILSTTRAFLRFEVEATLFIVPHDRFCQYTNWLKAPVYVFAFPKSFPTSLSPEPKPLNAFSLRLAKILVV